MKSETLLLTFAGLAALLALCNRSDVACATLLVGVIVWAVKLLEEIT